MSLEDLDYSDDVGLYDDIFDDIQPDEPTPPTTTTTTQPAPSIQAPVPIQQQASPPTYIQRHAPDTSHNAPVGILDPNKSDQGKIFVGALNWGTDEKMLQEYFSKFGEVVDCVIMREPVTGRSRGFGFLNFSTSQAVDDVLGVRHYLDGKSIDPKRAVPKDDQQRTEKIFVGGIAPSVDEFELKDFFTQFGKVLDATLMLDRETGRPRGFGFVTFESAEGVDRCIAKQGTLVLKDKLVEVKRAQPKGGHQPALPPRGIPQSNPAEMQQQMLMQQQMAMMQQNPMMMQMWMQMMQAQQMGGGNGGHVAEGMMGQMGNMNGYGQHSDNRDQREPLTSSRPVVRRDRERPKKAEGEYISSKYRAVVASKGGKLPSNNASPDRSETSRTRSPGRSRSRSRERSRLRDRSPRGDSLRHRPY